MAYSAIVKPSVYFNTKLYTGTGNDNTAITGIGFKPDWIWVKDRAGTDAHHIADIINGAGYRLRSNTDGALGTQADGVKSFDNDGFTAGTTGSINGNGKTYAAWNWKAGSNNTSVSASGSGNGAYNACTHRANTTAGFSIVQFTGRNGDIGNGNETRVTHGLGVKPDFVIIKRTDTSETWVVRGGGSPLQSDYHIQLNTTDARSGSYYVGQAQNDNATYFVVGNSGRTNQQGGTYIAYVFANKAGYSKYGSYPGNGIADGSFIYTGFKPAFVLIKRTSDTQSWVLWDNKRDGINQTNKSLTPNESGAEENRAIDLLSNGFKLRDTNTATNAASTYIYLAFAEEPLVANVGTDGVPTTAR